MNLADFLHAKIYSGKLKVTLIVIGWAWSNMGVAFKWLRIEMSCQRNGWWWQDKIKMDIDKYY